MSEIGGMRKNAVIIIFVRCTPRHAVANAIPYKKQEEGEFYGTEH
jgi:hypothetical protein